MTRRPNRDLVAAKEIATKLGVSSTVVTNWASRHDDFPEPIVELAMGRIWSWQEVLQWAATHKKIKETSQ